MSVALDDLDLRIIERLDVDARASNREIARDLGLTEGTIRARLKRLFENRVIRVTAVANTARLPNPILAYLWIEATTAGDIDALARAIADLPEIGFVAKLVGRADILAMTMVENGNDLIDFVHRTIDQLNGVRRVRYSLAQSFIKHDFRWCSLID